MTVDWSLFFPPGARVLALPDWRRPRLYLPAQRFGQRWGASSFYPAFRLPARLYRLALRSKAATGFGEVRMVRSDGWVLGEFVRDALPGAVSTTVLVGTPGPAQKITARLEDKEGKVLGFLKYAEKDAARIRLRREYRVLQAIPGGLAPKALGYGILGDGEALLTSPISGKRLSATMPPSKDAAHFLTSLAVSTPVVLEDHPWVKGVREQDGKGALDACFEVLAKRRWPVVVQHGDFAPWNLLRISGSRIVAFDWEYGALEGFPCLDLAYYALQISALIHRWSPAKAARRTVECLLRDNMFTLNGAEARTLTRLAAYDAHQKALEDGQAPGEGLQDWRREIWEGAACGV